MDEGQPCSKISHPVSFGFKLFIANHLTIGSQQQPLAETMEW